MLLEVPPGLWPELVAWLESRGLEVGRMPYDLHHQKPVYLTRPKHAPGDEEEAGK